MSSFASDDALMTVVDIPLRGNASHSLAEYAKFTLFFQSLPKSDKFALAFGFEMGSQLKGNSFTTATSCFESYVTTRISSYFKVPSAFFLPPLYLFLLSIDSVSSISSEAATLLDSKLVPMKLTKRSICLGWPRRCFMSS